VNERGKTDRDALRQAALAAERRVRGYEGPRTPSELALVEILAELLDAERVGVDSDFFELGIDSFTVVELLAAIEERFGVDLAAADLFELPTAAALAARLDHGAGSTNRLVVPLYTGGSGVPFFVVAGGGGTGMVALRRLGLRIDRPLYSFLQRGFLERARPDRTVERTAKRFVTALRAVRPAGPNLLGGYSFGCLVAFEMAQQLRSAGAEVALLVLFDPATSEAGQRERVERIARGRNRSPAGRVRTFGRLARHAGLWLKHGAISRTAGLVKRPPLQQEGAYFLLNLRLSRRYRPRPYGGKALVLRTRSWTSFDRIDLGGAFLSGEKQIVAVAGSHDTMLLEPHVAALVPLLRDALEATDQARALDRQTPVAPNVPALTLKGDEIPTEPSAS
jgi:thioesterase domain-containing protein/acyl carrier protein